ncbi:D-xylulose reductase A [Salinomyces thailandicus]|uniref:D-xylulose reductase A n=1 Tax=Salinomyces thailandicus TaxID=706561 RepID=A0A4V5N479_9PEZI|nr:D-xylulose reductase A [Salinomyces thailandica]
MRFAATPPVDGTLAKYYALPADFCYELGDHVTLEEGAVVEPLSIAVHVVRQANIKPGQSLVVFGAGPVGLLCCAVARRAYGASCVIAVDTNQERLAFARKYAATQTYKASGSSPEDTAAAILAECHTGSGVDAAIDASGAESCIQTAMHVLRTGGAYVQAGLGRQMISFPIGSVCSKELSIKGSFRYGPGDYELAVRLLNNGQVSVRELITDCFSFHESEKAFESVKAARGMKTLIRGPGQPLSSKFGRERARL